MRKFEDSDSVSNVQLEEKLFDVTCVVGSVYRSNAYGTSPRVAAFRLIAEHGVDGHFVFADHEGRYITHVTVSTEQP
jgi:hypothetical protein